MFNLDSLRLPFQWPVYLEDSDIILQPLKKQDASQWFAVRAQNSQWLSPWDASLPYPEKGPRSFGEMVKVMNRQGKEGSAIALGIFDRRGGGYKERGKLIGQVTVSNIAYGSIRGASIGYWLSEQYAGRSIMPRAVALVMDYCFMHRQLHRLEVNIRPENQKSLRVAEKLELREEGYRSSFLHIDGQWADHRCFAITEDEARVRGGVLNGFKRQHFGQY